MPPERSARHIKGMLFEYGMEKGKGYEDQNSYADVKVQASLLYSIVRIVKHATWA